MPPDKDTGVDYDNQPFSSGPYKITENTPGVQLVLERNTNWDPATDPVRHQYPDRFVWTFGPDGEAAANRIIADSGTDQTALDWNSVPSSLVSKAAPDPALQQRSLLAPTTSANRLTINNQRVTDLTIRQAINYAIDREGLIKTLGGQTVGPPITTLMPPERSATRSTTPTRPVRTATSTRPRNCWRAGRPSSCSARRTTPRSGDRHPAQGQPGEGRLHRSP